MSDKSLDTRTTSILTEHFGFAPLILIDDIINAVNEIMYKGTEAIEAYLKEQKKVKTSGIFTKISIDEIEQGVGKLETLLEFTVDSYFDKFELYCFRNVLNIPRELIPYVVLNHQQGIEFGKEKIKEKVELDKKIDNLRRKIELELTLRKLLKINIYKINKIYEVLKDLESKFKVFENIEMNQEKLKKLQPIDETMYFINMEIRNLTKQIETLSSRLDSNLVNHKFVPTFRDTFINRKTQRVLEGSGILEKSDSRNNHGDTDTPYKDILDSVQE